MIIIIIISKHLLYWSGYHGKLKASALEPIMNRVERKQDVCVKHPGKNSQTNKAMHNLTAAIP